MHAVPSASASGRLTFTNYAGFGAGSMAGTMLGWGILSLFLIFTLVLGVSPALVSLAQSLPRAVDILTDPLAGYLSDSWRHKFSRRFFIAIGSAVGGFFFILTYSFPSGLSQYGYFAWLLIFSSLALAGWSFLSIPLTALSIEMTARSSEDRNRLAAVSMMTATLAGLIYTWAYPATQLPLFGNPIQGTHWVGAFMGVLIIVFGLAAAVWCRSSQPDDEPPQAVSPAVRTPGFRDFITSTKRVTKNRTFMLLMSAVVIMTLGCLTSFTIGPYVAIYYVAKGNQAQGAVLMAAGGTAWVAGNLLGAAPILWVAKRIGKKRALLVFLGVTFVANLVKWFCYDPARPWLYVIPIALVGIGWLGLFVLSSSMTGDICDLDESVTGTAEAGMFSAFAAWVVKLGTTFAVAAAGLLVELSGFTAGIGAVQTPRTILMLRWLDFLTPVIAVVFAFILISRYRITAAQMQQVQAALAQRRSERAAVLST